MSVPSGEGFYVTIRLVRKTHCVLERQLADRSPRNCSQTLTTEPRHNVWRVEVGPCLISTVNPQHTCHCRSHPSCFHPASNQHFRSFLLRIHEDMSFTGLEGQMRPNGKNLLMVHSDFQIKSIAKMLHLNS